MTCPQCDSSRPVGAALRYATFACRTCQRAFNQRTGTPFNAFK